jgi:hypothetical protein
MGKGFLDLEKRDRGGKISFLRDLRSVVTRLCSSLPSQTAVRFEINVMTERSYIKVWRGITVT